MDRFVVIIRLDIDIDSHVPNDELGLDMLQKKHRLTELVKEAVREGNFSYVERGPKGLNKRRPIVS